MDSITGAFNDDSHLARELFAVVGEHGNDGSHDRSHLLRVWQNANAIAAHEPACDRTVLAAAIILHDCVSPEKNAPDHVEASRRSAARARTILAGLGWRIPQIDSVAHAIEAHSFSARIIPRTPEARILQDADRLDAIGAVGIARCFYVAGRMGSSLYDAADPAAFNRPLDDQAYALDHFDKKLFKIAENFQTKPARPCPIGAPGRCGPSSPPS